ncbi:hypothetical protein QTP88_021429 [Uroleucon formosanum]
MKVKRNCTTGILLIIGTLMTNTDSVLPKNRGGRLGRISKAKESITSFFTMSPQTYQNWKTSTLARSFNKAVGFAPIVKENDVDKLLDLLANEADLIKLGVYRKLSKLYSSATTWESKKKLILAKIQATIELVKYYGVSRNCPKAKLIAAQGMYYVHICKKLFGEEKQGECLKKQIQLYTAFVFAFRIEINRFLRFFLNRTKRKVDKYLPDDKAIKFLDTKVACELKFLQDNKNIFLRTAMKLYMSTSKRNRFNCVKELLSFQDNLKEIDSYPSEIHYLLARAYGLQNNNALALDHLRKARNEKVVDSKTRKTNIKVQAYYEKIYTRVYSIPTGRR